MGSKETRNGENERRGEGGGGEEGRGDKREKIGSGGRRDERKNLLVGLAKIIQEKKKGKEDEKQNKMDEKMKKDYERRRGSKRIIK